MEHFKITEIPRTGGRWGYRNMLAGGLNELMLVVSMRKRNFNKDITVAVIWRNGTTKGQSERNQEQDRQIRVRKWFDEKRNIIFNKCCIFLLPFNWCCFSFFVSWECWFVCSSVDFVSSAALS